MRIFAAIVGILFSVSVFAADAPVKYLEGKDYSLLDTPVAAVNPGKIEVTEVFSFICPHCFRFEPLVEEWEKKQKPDVALVQIHTQWSEQMKFYQRGYYTAVTLKIKNKVQLPIFNHIHKDGKALDSAEAWADFLSAYGVGKQTVLSTYNSFIVGGLMSQADTRTRALKITSTPELVVDGRYKISTPGGMDEAKAHEQMLQIADFLIAQVRAERAAKH
jgi:thiol:disulfide interchange protein DsbA